MKNTKRKAFTLVELLVVIAIIGILFVVLISKVDFATEKSKASGVQTDFRSYQLAIETVARENAGLSTLIDDTASGEEKYAALESALNKNLDPKLRVEIDADGNITTDAKDPWKEQYLGAYLAPDADGTVKDRGAIVMYCKGSNLKLGTTSETVNGVVNITVESGKETEGADDYAISTIYTYVNGYGEIRTTTDGFSNDMGDEKANQGNNTPVNPEDPDTPDDPEQGNSGEKEHVLNEDGFYYNVPYVSDEDALVFYSDGIVERFAVEADIGLRCWDMYEKTAFNQELRTYEALDQWDDDYIFTFSDDGRSLQYQDETYELDETISIVSSITPGMRLIYTNNCLISTKNPFEFVYNADGSFTLYCNGTYHPDDFEIVNVTGENDWNVATSDSSEFSLHCGNLLPNELVYGESYKVSLNWSELLWYLSIDSIEVTLTLNQDGSISIVGEPCAVNHMEMYGHHLVKFSEGEFIGGLTSDFKYTYLYMDME